MLQQIIDVVNVSFFGRLGISGGGGAADRVAVVVLQAGGGTPDR